jgi:hypothetical protein
VRGRRTRARRRRDIVKHGLEILGALGVILPWLTGIAPILTPIAATGLVVVQIGALRVHLIRNERQPLPANVLLLVLAAFAAAGRFPG